MLFSCLLICTFSTPNPKAFLSEDKLSLSSYLHPSEPHTKIIKSQDPLDTPPLPQRHGWASNKVNIPPALKSSQT